MNLTDHFDAVVMLTWSDWKNEPRSNRYHYATRFARELPVLFLQHLYKKETDFSVLPSEVQNLDLVHVNCGLNERDVMDIKSLLVARGIKRPLLWIYDSLNYQPLIDALPNAFRVYHATEDYLTKTQGWNQGMEATGQSVVRMLAQVDYMVACTPGVANSYLTTGGYSGPYSVIENGCDAEYFLEFAEAHAQERTRSSLPVAIFQGGINQRLDYDLIAELVRLMPDWEFRFCGAAVESEAWSELLKQRNVRYVGALPPEEFARHMCDSTVGIIPYIQDQWIRNSLPLKAYEYVACGLPVVTVPITALERDADLIVPATTAKEFADSIRSVATSRFEAASLEARRRAALATSYNKRFAMMREGLLEARAVLSNSRKRLHVAMLYDCMISMHVSTIREHLAAFDRYSHHVVTYIPATPEFWKRSAEEISELVDLSVFDVAVIHFSTRLSVREHFDEGLAREFERFCGLKVLFIQDEYEGTEVARSWMDRLKFDLIYTCVPRDGLEYVYPPYRFPATEFLPTLTGYVPEDLTLEKYAQPLMDRELLIAYRGRKLPAVYGELGFEKYRIGVEMKIIAGMRGIPVDIEVDDAKRIYGSAWYEFLGSARATLGTESGANVFDFDGSLRGEIARLQAADPDITFEEISAKVLTLHDGRVKMNQISPKVFEAIRLRTVLVLFEGSYSGVVRPDEHYIPLKKDFSNIDEVLAKIQDDDFVLDLTRRAYEDIVASGKFSYRTFVEGVDSDFERRVIVRKAPRLLIGPLLSVAQDGSFKSVLPALPLGIVAGAHPLGCPMSLSEMAELRQPPHSSAALRSGAFAIPGVSGRSMRLYRIARSIWHCLPVLLRGKLIGVAGWVLQRKDSARHRNGFLMRTARRGWHLFPSFVRIRLARFVESNRMSKRTDS
ncbi:glycosyltransferase [Methyloversatilis sp.]|uniref:glycosyltransferase n=1 Tax=Methyloversatilis sp. TaxID=2569862 RepID=UPI0027B8B590|nr:glycosyltransferase [Methyloversatilis sp.]